MARQALSICIRSEKELTEEELNKKAAEWENADEANPPEEVTQEAAEERELSTHETRATRTSGTTQLSETDEVAAQMEKAAGDELANFKKVFPETSEALAKSATGTAEELAEDLASEVGRDVERLALEAGERGAEEILGPIGDLVACTYTIGSGGDAAEVAGMCFPLIGIVEVVGGLLIALGESIYSLIESYHNFKLLERERQAVVRDAIQAIKEDAASRLQYLDAHYHAAAAGLVSVNKAAEKKIDHRARQEAKTLFGLLDIGDVLDCESQQQSLSKALEAASDADTDFAKTQSKTQDVAHDFKFHNDSDAGTSHTQTKSAVRTAVDRLYACLRNGLADALAPFDDTALTTSKLETHVEYINTLNGQKNQLRSEFRNGVEHLRERILRQARDTLGAYQGEHLDDQGTENPIHDMQQDLIDKLDAQACKHVQAHGQADCTWNSDYTHGKVTIDGDVYLYALPLIDDQVISHWLGHFIDEYGLFPLFLKELRPLKSLDAATEKQKLYDALVIYGDHPYLQPYQAGELPMPLKLFITNFFSPLLERAYSSWLSQAYPALAGHFRQIVDKLIEPVAALYGATDGHELPTLDCAKVQVCVVLAQPLKGPGADWQLEEKLTREQALAAVASKSEWQVEKNSDGQARIEQLPVPDAWVRYEHHKDSGARRAVIRLHPKADQCPGCVLYAEQVTPHIPPYDHTQQTPGKWYIYGEHFTDPVALAVYLGGMPEGKTGTVLAQTGDDGNNWKSYGYGDQNQYQELVGTCGADAMANAGKAFRFNKVDGHFYLGDKTFDDASDVVFAHCGLSGFTEKFRAGEANRNQVVVYHHPRNDHEVWNRVKYICHADAAEHPGETLTEYLRAPGAWRDVEKYPASVSFEEKSHLPTWYDKSEFLDDANDYCGTALSWQPAESGNDGHGNTFTSGDADNIFSHKRVRHKISITCGPNSRLANKAIHAEGKVQEKCSGGSLTSNCVYDYTEWNIKDGSYTAGSMDEVRHMVTTVCGPNHWGSPDRQATYFGSSVIRYWYEQDGIRARKYILHCSGSADKNAGQTFIVFLGFPGDTSRSYSLKRQWTAYQNGKLVKETGDSWSMNDMVAEFCGRGGYRQIETGGVQGNGYWLYASEGNERSMLKKDKPRRKLVTQCSEHSERHPGSRHELVTDVYEHWWTGAYRQWNLDGTKYDDDKYKDVVRDYCGKAPRSVFEVALRAHNGKFIDDNLYPASDAPVYGLTVLNYIDFWVFLTKSGKYLKLRPHAWQNYKIEPEGTGLNDYTKFRQRGLDNGQMAFQSFYQNRYLSAHAPGWDYRLTVHETSLSEFTKFDVWPGASTPVQWRSFLHDTSKCMVADGQNVRIGSCINVSDGSGPPKNQDTWYCNEQGMIMSALKQKCMQAQGSGQPLLLRDCDKTNARQKWDYQSGKLRSKATGHCIDIPHANTGNVNINTWRNCHGEKHQLWYWLR